MTWFVRAFIKSSLSWLVVGLLYGLGMAGHPQWVVYRAGHAHAMLLGFVTMLIAGLAYHVIPRFAGRPLSSPTAAAWHLWLANLGTATMLIGFWQRDSGLEYSRWVLGAGGTLNAIALGMFVWQIWATLDRPKPSRLIAVQE